MLLQRRLQPANPGRITSLPCWLYPPLPAADLPQFAAFRSSHDSTAPTASARGPFNPASSQLPPLRAGLRVEAGARRCGAGPCQQRCGGLWRLGCRQHAVSRCVRRAGRCVAGILLQSSLLVSFGKRVWRKFPANPARVPLGVVSAFLLTFG